MQTAPSNRLPAPECRIDIGRFIESAARRPLRERPRALLIEDQRIFRKILIEVLSRQCDVYAANDGSEGLRLYAAAAPDIVFLDINLPDLNGQAILRTITQTDKDSFVVMLTASKSLEDIKAATQQGAKGYIVKPFSRQKLEDYLTLWRSQRMS